MSTVILIVDDEPGIPKAIKEYLEDAGDYRILVATDGEHGLAVLEEQDVAVCIVDMRLPGMSGNEFIPLAHAVRPGCRFIIHTGSLGYSPTRELRALGVTADMVVGKPVMDMAVFAGLIAKLTDQAGQEARL